MEKVYGYIRVSTTKQGDGVSLQEQKSAIEEFVHRNNLEILEWFEEKETAAKEGRPIFNKMIKLLSNGKADGVCFHKIDRSSRNFGDWNKINILADAGINIYSVSDGINLSDEASRLPADILAAMSAHYIRNLRKEVLKGFYGRLKQGYYPLPAPLGYIDKGSGNRKEIDPFVSSLIKKTFELYSSSQFSLIELAKEMNKRGLRSKRGNPVSKMNISRILRNPFYMGIIKIQKTGEVFIGSHQPIISKALFNRVQEIMDNKYNKKIRKHNLPFRKMLKCHHCKYSLIGEIQKGFVYYRCHTKNCPTSPIKQEKIIDALTQFISDISLSPKQLKKMKSELNNVILQDKEIMTRKIKKLKFNIVDLDEKLNKLMDALIEGLIENDIFLKKKERLLSEKVGIQGKIDDINHENSSHLNYVDKFLEPLENLNLKDIQRNYEILASMVKFSTSNLLYDGRRFVITSFKPFSLVFHSKNQSFGGHYEDSNRTNYTTKDSETLTLVYRVDTPNKKISKKINIEKFTQSLITNNFCN